MEGEFQYEKQILNVHCFWFLWLLQKESINSKLKVRQN